MTNGEESYLNQLSPLKVFINTSIKGGVPETGGFIPHNISEIAADENSSIFLKSSHISTSEVDIFGATSTPYGISQISSSQDSTIKTRNSGLGQINVTQIDSAQDARKSILLLDKNLEIFRTRKLIDFSTVSGFDKEIGKVSLPSSISSQQSFNVDLLFRHDNTSLLTSIYSTAQTLWHNTPIDLNFAITNLPTGQLAEGTITSYNPNGTPKTATISIDDDANGVGWFIDTTPQHNSEFTGTDTYFQATPNSPASGKYDLLTALLHEMGHTLGFINGYNQFNQNIKGRQFYADPTHAYTLSSDLSHLDNTLYPNDLLNTNLKPGIRKLPSTMDWAIIHTISGTGGLGALASNGTVNPAHLTAGALIGITNGDFTTPTTWNTTGSTKDTNTFTPLAGTSIGLNHTDSLLNIQANGTIYKSDKVTLTTLNNKQIVTHALRRRLRQRRIRHHPQHP
jgi:hypothetical protein